MSMGVSKVYVENLHIGLFQFCKSVNFEYLALCFSKQATVFKVSLFPH